MPAHHSDQAAREVCQVLLTLSRCISMKRALGVIEDDHLNFFRLYDGCLMDVTVISWWKIFGNRCDASHWRNLFRDECHGRIESKLHEVAGCERQYDFLWKKVRAYRNKYVAHHEFDHGERPSRHPYLPPLRDTGWVIYDELFRSLSFTGKSCGLADPDNISGDRLERIEAHWREISIVAREATKSLRDAPLNP